MKKLYQNSRVWMLLVVSVANLFFGIPSKAYAVCVDYPFGYLYCGGMGEDCCDACKCEPTLVCDRSLNNGTCVGNPDGNSLIEYTSLGAGLFQAVYKIILPIAILIGVVLAVINGYKLMTSQGDPRKVQDGKEGITSAIMGIVFVLLATFIVHFVLEGFLGKP